MFVAVIAFLLTPVGVVISALVALLVGRKKAREMRH